MEKRSLKISFMKSGSGSTSSRITLPITWIKKMGLDIDNREVEVSFNEKDNSIKIEPKK
ncbi:MULTISPECIES: AbrB/MazE/SpoVT family DNA-binding domain-containing protein [Bacteria]|uniref:AbrB/MazE/SpoVT family DNA-binding domain-containing protein n=1 Tax=Bacteria TaxID=2 RepID=UPI003EE5401C